MAEALPTATADSCRVPNGKLTDKKQKYHHVTLGEFYPPGEGACMVQKNINQSIIKINALSLPVKI